MSKNAIGFVAPLVGDMHSQFAGILPLPQNESTRTMKILKTLIYTLLVLASCLFVSKTSADLVVGGFNGSRSGNFGFASGSQFSGFRNGIAANYAGVSFTGSSVLTTSYLDTIDVLIVGPATNFASGTALTSSEQTALLGFVQSGGGVILMPDNDTYQSGADAINESYTDPFGVDITGTNSGLVNTTIVGPVHPVTNGPYGSVSSFAMNFPGWFDHVNGGTVLGSALGQPRLLAFDFGSFGVSSGRVVMFSDINWANSGSFGYYNNAQNSRLALNSFDYVVPISNIPEPGSFVFGLSALSVLTFYQSIRRRRTDQ